MLPGKKYKPEDLLRLAKKRMWLLLVPFAVVSAGTAAVARKLPDFYQASTLVLVVPQKVPESYVRSTITTSIEDRLNTIREQIMSRTRLERLIEDFNLYADERREGAIMEDVYQKMKLDIDVRILRSDAFRVTYIGREPRTVARVTEKLASLFIDESTHDRESVADNASQFLDGQLEDLRRRLAESEKRVADYRSAHRGELPSQLEANLASFSNTALEIQSLVQKMHDDQARRLILERQLSDLEAPGDAGQVIEMPSTPTVVIGPDGNPIGTTAQILSALKSQLAGLEARKFLPGHPDVISVKKRIAEFEKKAEDEALAQPVTRPMVQVLSPAEMSRRNKVLGLRESLEQLSSQLAYKAAEEKRLRGELARLQARIDAAPTRETEMTEISRDYAQLNTQYLSMLGKREESKLAASLERRQIGEQFKLLDAARVPERPFKPDRRQINMMGMAAGLGIGLALVGLLEYRDSTFKTDDEVIRVLSLPVLAVVPVMLSEGERRRSFRWRLILNAGLGSVVAVCLAVLLYTFVR